ncbi:META domain protein [Pseudoruegeria aquimaris]|uniref:META domain protein n=2 Tax=Pseudoruegeria aquimaris TaxID=393663 RepID=A0A1Y5S1Q9_9RHOB|nr:META domain protein [Pseudoruegeria aquimaris]
MLRATFLLALGLSACQPDETISGYAGTDREWRLVEAVGQPITQRITLTFPEEGEIAGHAPCNAYTARQTLPYPWFKIEGLAATRAACPELELEGTYFAMLMSMSLSEVAGDTLILSNEAGMQLVYRAAPD